MNAPSIWIQLSKDLEPYRRTDAPVISRTPEGDLAVNGEPVIERIALTCGLVILATATGVTVISRDTLRPWATPISPGLARDLQA
ncbi:MAG: hypothetical protein HC822_12935 [Oscillochloris sp.]|nr:hypothetical protein [Oscillochloris sp.]